MRFPGGASAVREVGALSDLDNISVRIADVAARLAVFGDGLRDELRSEGCNRSRNLGHVRFELTATR